MTGDKFLPPPYTYIENIDFAGKEAWSVPDSKIVCEVRCVALAADTDFVIRVDTVYGLGKDMRGRGENIWRIRAQRIHRLGTTKEVRERIEVYGYDKSEIDRY